MMKKMLLPILFSAASVFAIPLLVSNHAEAKPVVSCNDLEGSEAQKYKELTEKAYAAYDSGDMEEAIAYFRQIVSFCNEDFTEANLAAVYLQNGMCSMASFHFNNILERGDVQGKMAKSIKAKLKKIAAECPDVLAFEILCADNQTLLDIPALSVVKAPCPFYGMLAPGEYVVSATKEGCVPVKEFLSISDTSDGTLKIPELIEVSRMGNLSIACPPEYQKFYLVNDENPEKVDTYDCPWEGPLVVGNYTVYMDAERSKAYKVEVKSVENTKFTVPKPSVMCACQVSNPTSSRTPYFVYFVVATTAAVGLLSRRRRKELETR